jgi:large subunit ribosomal protein LP1
MASQQELACIYAALALYDDGVAVTGDKIKTILKAANIEIEPFWADLYAKSLADVDLKSLVSNISSGVGTGGASAGPAAAAPAAAAGGAAPAKEEKKKEEKKEESEDEDMGFGLFD